MKDEEAVKNMMKDEEAVKIMICILSRGRGHSNYKVVHMRDQRNAKGCFLRLDAIHANHN